VAVTALRVARAVNAASTADGPSRLGLAAAHREGVAIVEMSKGRGRLAMTVREAAASLGVGKDAVYKAINRGDVRAVKLGGTLLVPRVELERFLGVEDDTEPMSVADVLGELAAVLQAQTGGR
jgi:excisionase family DNA binding protein